MEQLEYELALIWDACFPDGGLALYVCDNAGASGPNFILRLMSSSSLWMTYTVSISNYALTLSLQECLQKGKYPQYMVLSFTMLPLLGQFVNVKAGRRHWL